MGNAPTHPTPPTHSLKVFTKIPISLKILLSTLETKSMPYYGNKFCDQINTLYFENDSAAQKFFLIDDLLITLYEHLTFSDNIYDAKLLTICIAYQQNNLLENALQICRKKGKYTQIVFRGICERSFYHEPYIFETIPVKSECTSESQAKLIIKNIDPHLQKMFIAMQFLIFKRKWFHLLPEYLEGKQQIQSINVYPSCSPLDTMDHRLNLAPPTTNLAPLFYDCFIFMARYRNCNRDAFDACDLLGDITNDYPTYFFKLRDAYQHNPQIVALLKLSIDEAIRAHVYDFHHNCRINWPNLLTSI